MDVGEAAIAHLREEVAQVKWWHQINLGDGIVTPGRNDSRKHLASIRLPEDLSGKSVLDVGTWDGFYAFEAERRGATRVVAMDSYCWNRGTGKAGFDLARRALGSRVEDRQIDLLDLSPETVGTFDVVLFLGVLYHLPHPLLCLEKLASVTAEQLIVETHVDMLWTRRPAMAFYPAESSEVT